jgi:hypothetical protein
MFRFVTGWRVCTFSARPVVSNLKLGIVFCLVGVAVKAIPQQSADWWSTGFSGPFRLTDECDFS